MSFWDRPKLKSHKLQKLLQQRASFQSGKKHAFSPIRQSPAVCQSQFQLINFRPRKNLLQREEKSSTRSNRTKSCSKNTLFLTGKFFLEDLTKHENDIFRTMLEAPGWAINNLVSFASQISVRKKSVKDRRE